MTWTETVPTILVATLIIFLPGAFLARAMGARGLAWVAVAVPLTVSLVAVGTIGAGAIGLKWNPVVLGIFAIAAAGVVWGGRKLIAVRLAVVRGQTRGGQAHTEPGHFSHPRPTPAMVLSGIGGLMLGAATLGANLARTFIAPENISQTYDNVHHLSAIRAILDSGNGSAFSVGSMIHNGPSGLYPFVWHNLVALTVQSTDATIPVATNAVNIVIGSLVWTVACMYLATRVSSTRPAVLLTAGALAGSFGAYPFLALGWGVLYPNFLAIALLPIFIGVVADVLKLSVKPRIGTVLGCALLVIGTPGLALAHPNILMALAAFTIPLLLFWLVRLFNARKFKWQVLAGATLGVVGYLLVFATAWDRIRPSAEGSHWPPSLTLLVALRETIAVAPLQIELSIPVFMLMLLGCVAVLIHRSRLWTLILFLVSAMFFVVVASFPEGPLRNAITGVFFNDSNRLAAMLPAMALPLMVTGAVWIFDLAVKMIPSAFLTARPRAVVMAVMGVVVAVILGLAGQSSSVKAIVAETGSEYYASTPDSWLLSSDEAALLKRSHEHIPAGAIVIGHPANGGSLIYALENYPTVVPSLASARSTEIKTIWAHLPQIAEDPAVCEAVRKLDAYYYLDFGSGRQVSDMRQSIPSSTDIEVTPGLTLLDGQGAARLYRIDTCG